jgi:hypothetical protein
MSTPSLDDHLKRMAYLEKRFAAPGWMTVPVAAKTLGDYLSVLISAWDAVAKEIAPGRHNIPAPETDAWEQLSSSINSVDEIFSMIVTRKKYRDIFLQLCTPEDMHRFQAYGAQLAQLRSELPELAQKDPGEAYEQGAKVFLKHMSHITVLALRAANEMISFREFKEHGISMG